MQKNNSDNEASCEASCDASREVSDEETEVAKTSNSSKARITLDSLNIVATWEYNTDNASCTLCNNDLMSAIPANINNKKTYVNNIIVGICNHGFHETCIDSLMSNSTDSSLNERPEKFTNSISCPICKTPWVPNNSVGSSVCVYRSTV